MIYCSFYGQLSVLCGCCVYRQWSKTNLYLSTVFALHIDLQTAICTHWFCTHWFCTDMCPGFSNGIPVNFTFSQIFSLNAAFQTDVVFPSFFRPAHGVQSFRSSPSQHHLPQQVTDWWWAFLYESLAFLISLFQTVATVGPKNLLGLLKRVL